MHCALQYAFKYGESKEFKEYMNNHQTLIILNGGTTRFAKESLGTFYKNGELNEIAIELGNVGIPVSCFYEPDLNYALSAVCFLADERVWDFENYPDWEEPKKEIVHDLWGKPIYDFTIDDSLTYNDWVESIGGENNEILRGIIKDRRLA